MITSFAVWFCYLKKFEAIYILFFCSVFINICFYDYSHITPLFLPFDFISLRFYYQVIAESAAYILRKRCLETQFLIRFQLYSVLLNSSMDSSICVFFCQHNYFVSHLINSIVIRFLFCHYISSWLKEFRFNN